MQLLSLEVIYISSPLNKALSVIRMKVNVCESKIKCLLLPHLLLVVHLKRFQMIFMNVDVLIFIKDRVIVVLFISISTF